MPVPRGRLLLAAACVVGVAAALLAEPVAHAATPESNVLRTGQCLSASADHADAALVASSGRFEADVTRTGLVLRNVVLLNNDSMAAARTTWVRPASSESGGPTQLCMLRDGNLVLRGDGVVAWSSHTAGSGTDNYAMLRNNGRLVVRTASDRVVWSSATTAVLLIAGDRLASGGVLRNYTDPEAVTRLVMRRQGDLVLMRGSVPVWHTGTHVPGSYLSVGTKGRLLVHAPSGEVIWRSAAVGELPLVSLAPHGRLTVESLASGHCWTRPLAGCA